MAVLQKAASCVIPLLLCLRLPSTAPQALHKHPDGQEIAAEVRAAPQLETLSVGLQRPTAVQGVTSEADLSSGQQEHQNDHLNEQQTWKEDGEMDFLQTQNFNLKESTVQDEGAETRDGKGNTRTAEDSEDYKEGRQDEAPQPVIQTSGWFSNALNVTTRPVVTWSRRAAHARPSPLRKEEDEQEEEEQENDVLLTVKFIGKDHPLVLDLHLTRDLMAASYKESSGGGGGNDTLPGETRQCEYQGAVRGVQETWVALSVCGGLSGVVAVTLEEGKEVELLVEPSPGSTSPHQPHRIFSAALLELPEAACGVKDSDLKPEVAVLGNPTTDEKTTTNASHRGRRWAGLVGEALWYERSTRFVEMVLVADHAFYVTHGARTRSRCKSIANIVNAMYRPLGVVVVLSHIEVWERGDKIPVSGNYTQNLQALRKYRRDMLMEKHDYNNDVTMLMTTVDFYGSTVGYAVISGICMTETSVGMVQDKQEQLVLEAYKLSHELGHIFGMIHDNQRENEGRCQCPTSACIMGASGTFQSHVSWSSCSRKVIEKRVDSESYKCLRNVPTRMYPSSSCGDGVVDEGEQCDCGPTEYCSNPCCVAATCRFAVNASCASGPCCDTKKCHFKPQGVRCRDAYTECDLPEFCSGNSESCPGDVTKADGTPCREGQGYCYEAQCGSHQERCQVVWGQSATVAHDDCFSEVNTKGRSNGNCGFKGHTKTEYLPCDERDAFCGSLQCLTQPGDAPLRKGINYNAIFVSQHRCSYIATDDRMPSRYWLSPDGAKCANGKMCLKQKCVKVPEPSGHCRDGCSGRGVCNSRNHCHCHPGFAPPHCSTEGAGGSIDSNSTERERYKDPVWEAIFILFLIILGAAILLCCLWTQVRRWWEGRGRASTPPFCARCLDACCCPLMSLITDYLCTRKERKDRSKEAQGAWEQDKMMCEVDLDVDDNESHTRPSDDRLVTKVVVVTAEKSSDLRRKMPLLAHDVVHQDKTAENAGHPTYMQSVSVDSGCVSDVEETPGKEALESRVSMNSLSSLFKKFGTRTSPSPAEESSPPKTFDRQQSVPLRRLVVDRVAGRCTPPPEHVKQSTGTGRPLRAPPPPPSTSGKPSTSKDKFSQVCRSGNERVACQEDVHLQRKGHDLRTPGSNTPPVPPPVRPAPTLPPAPPVPLSETKKPKVPPGKKQTLLCQKKEAKNEVAAAERVNPVKDSQQKGKSIQISAPKRPLLPPARGPERPPAASSTPPPSRGAAPPSTTAGRVKDLAKRLEHK